MKCFMETDCMEIATIILRYNNSHFHIFNKLFHENEDNVIRVYYSEIYAKMWFTICEIR